MPTVALSATADAWVDQMQPTDNFGNLGYLIVGELYSDSPNPRTVGVARAWIKFDLSSIPASATIHSASLSFNVQYTSDDYGVELYEIYRSADLSWGELAITWNNQPGTTGAAVTFELSSSEDPPGGVGVHYVNVKAMVEAALASAGISFMFKNEQENGKGMWMTDRAYPFVYHPTLTIDYTAIRRRGHTVLLAD